MLSIMSQDDDDGAMDSSVVWYNFELLLGEDTDGNAADVDVDSFSLQSIDCDVADDNRRFEALGEMLAPEFLS